jgi:uncharacterized protein
MKKTWVIVTGFAFFILGIVFYFSTRTSLSATEIDWRLLGELDYITGQSSGELKAFDGQRVKIPGFMVPLEDHLRRVTDFLLVPSPQACIHVPPPPPNQMIYVKAKGDGFSTAFGPIWVYGQFKINVSKSVYGESSFQMEAESVEPYP